MPVGNARAEIGRHERRRPTPSTTGRRRPNLRVVPVAVEGDHVQQIEAFLADHTDRRGLRPRSIVNYRERLGRMLPALDELTPAGFRALAKREGWGPATIASYYATLSCFTEWRLRVGLADEDAFAGMKPPAMPAGSPKPVSPEQLAQLLLLAKDRPRRKSWPVDEWAIMAAYAGLRTFEIAKVRREDLQQTFDGGYELLVDGKGGTRASIPVGPEVAQLFEGRPAGELWPEATADTIQEAGRRLFRRAGLPGGLHRLRHTFATAVYRRTQDPFLTQRLCRHNSLQSTLTYAQLADDRLRSAVTGLHG